MTWQFGRSFSNIVGIVTCCRLDGSGSNPGKDRKCPDWFWGLPSLLLNGKEGTWPGREVNHSPPSSAKIKNEWSCTSSSHICLCDMDRENFTFLY